MLCRLILILSASHSQPEQIVASHSGRNQFAAEATSRVVECGKKRQRGSSVPKLQELFQGTINRLSVSRKKMVLLGHSTEN